MPKTLQYPTWASKPRDANYDVVTWGVGAANPGTSVSITIPVLPAANPPYYTILIGIAGQNGVTYSVTGDSAPFQIATRDGVGTHAEIRYAQVAASGGNITFIVNASSSVKFGVIVIAFNGEMLSANPQLDKKDNNVDGPGTAHLSGAAGFTTSGNGSFTLAIGCPSSDPGTITYDANYVGLPSSNGLVVFQCASRDAPNVLTSTQASFTTANSVSECTNVMATFTVKSTPSQFVTAIQPQPTVLTYPRRIIDPGWVTGPVAPVAPVVVPSSGWMMQQPEAPPKIKPAQQGWFAQPMEPTLFTPFNIGWYVQHPVAPPKTKVPDPGWYAHNISPITGSALIWGWYQQQPDPIQYKKPMPESYFVMPTVLLNFNGIANVFDVHLVTAVVSGVNLIVPVTTSTTLQNP